MLKEKRIAAGITQKELADRSGINLRTIQEYELGRRDFLNARVGVVYDLAVALGVTMEELISKK